MTWIGSVPLVSYHVLVKASNPLWLSKRQADFDFKSYQNRSRIFGNIQKKF